MNETKKSKTPFSFRLIKWLLRSVMFFGKSTVLPASLLGRKRPRGQDGSDGQEKPPPTED